MTLKGNSKAQAKAYSYYPGCSLHGTAREFDESARSVCQAVGIELRELDGWICCGASAAHSTDRLLGLALPAHTLVLAEKQGLPLAVPCAMCFSRLRHTLSEIKDDATHDLVNQILRHELVNSVPVESLLTVLADESVKIPVVRPLTGLNVACYYGCLLARPPEVVEPDDPENPQIMDGLMRRLGAEAVDWGLKTACCGAGVPFARPDVVFKLSHRILLLAQQSGADVISVACPMCHSNLDMYQKDISATFGQKVHMPVLYFTQLMGLALGFSFKDLQLHKHITNPVPVLRKKLGEDEG